MRRRTKNKVAVIVLSVIAVIALISAGMFCFVWRTTSDELTASVIEKDENINEMMTVISESSEKITALEDERQQLNIKIVSLEEEKQKLTEQVNNVDERFSELNKSISELNEQIEKKDKDIQELKDNIKKLESVYSVDINKQFEILSQLNNMLDNIPDVEIITENLRDDGTIEEVITYRKPKIAIYYEDINKGYKYSYNESEAFDSASLIKAPFILSVLMKETDYPGTYDFDEKFVYTKDAYQEGSGKIKDEPEGTEYTYKQLIEYVLKYSDNVAYFQLTGKYRYTEFNSLIYKLRARTIQKKGTDISAVDGGKVMRAIYDFLESDSPYADFMRECMTDSAHTVMIPYGVYPTKVAHKYGWDTGAYHDMGIVYNDNPYILVILSDMEEGGQKVNEYIQSVVRQVAKLHANFYAK